MSNDLTFLACLGLVPSLLIMWINPTAPNILSPVIDYSLMQMWHTAVAGSILRDCLELKASTDLHLHVIACVLIFT